MNQKIQIDTPVGFLIEIQRFSDRLIIYEPVAKNIVTRISKYIE